jgi:hypothetical protein
MNNKLLSKVSKEELETLIEEGLTMIEIANRFDLDPRRISELRIYYSLEFKNKRHILKKNDTFFDSIDNEIKAYLLGYLIADGCICVEPKKRDGIIYAYNYRIAFCCSVDDETTVSLFRDYICPENTIKYVNNTQGAKNRKLQCHLKWSSRYMVEKLINYHILPNKTQDILFQFDFDIIKDKSLIPHFFRGFFDGDGWITTNQNCIGFVSTSKPFCQQIIQYFEQFDIRFGLYTQQSKNMEYYQISCSRKEYLYKFYQLLYTNANFFLQRKKDKFSVFHTTPR